MNTDVVPNTTIIVQTKYFVSCLKCGAPVATYEHLKPRQSTEEFCKECGAGMRFVLDEQGRPSDFIPSLLKRVNTLVLLALNTQITPVGSEGPVMFVVKSFRLIDHDKELDLAEAQVWDHVAFAERECPASWLGMRVFLGKEDDPHGLVEHIETIKYPTLEQTRAAGISEGIYQAYSNTGEFHCNYESLCKLFTTLPNREW